MEVKHRRDLKDKIKEKFKNISNTKIYLISFFLTTAMTYRYAANRFLYREHHGHFNSPQNMLNKRVFQHHLQEVFLRLGFGFVGISGLFLISRGILRGPDYEAEDKNEISKTKTETKNDDIQNFGKSENFEFGNALERELKSEKNFAVDDILKSKKVVDEYFKNNK